MAQIVYPWKRFWCPRGGETSLADDGFLLDPESEYAKYHHSDVVSFESIGDTSCMVLLGEPGIGKSTALKAEFESVRQSASVGGDPALFFDLRDYSSDDRLERKVFQCDAIRDWQTSNQTLHLFLDSLDEGLLQMDNISRVLLDSLDDLPFDRIRLRIASRPADWQLTLEDGFNRIWGKQRVGIFELAPLRRADVACAAGLSGIDSPDEFVTALIAKDVVTLAINPATLKFLVGSYAKNGTLPASRAELYLEGCRRLCEESNPHRRDSPKGRGNLTIEQRLAIAARIAAVTQLSNRSAIYYGTMDSLEPEDVSLESLVGGTESDPSGVIVVGPAAVREVLDTGMFASRGLQRQGWRHQTYSEFLAAHYLNCHRVTPQKLVDLLIHPDGSGKVIPQIRETAAWLAEMSVPAFEILVRTDPEVVLRSEMTQASHADRANLAKRLLELFDSGSVSQSLWEVRQHFDRLANPELTKIIKPYLTDSSRRADARIAAMEIISACRLIDLQGELVAVAQNASETNEVRAHAAETICAIGNDMGRRALRPLALGQAGDDPQDDLRGYGLTAVWPKHITAEELFAALTPIKNPLHLRFGPYARFLDSRIADSLGADSIVAAAAWAREHARGRDELDPIHRLATDILVKAVDHIDEPPVLEQLAAALFERKLVFADCERITAKLRASGDERRRHIASAMFLHATTDRLGPYHVTEVCALNAQDVPWLLSELTKASDAGVRKLIAELIARTLDPNNVDAFADVLTSSFEIEELRAAIDRYVAPINLDSPVAEQMKSHYRDSLEYQKPKPVVLVKPIAEAVSETLIQNGSDVFFNIFFLLRDQKTKSAEVGEPIAGWSQLGQDLRAQILAAARSYSTIRPPAPPGAWWTEGRSTWGLLAVYGALYLLADQSPDSLDQIADQEWEFLTKAVLMMWTDGASRSARSILIAKAYERARNTFLETLVEVIDAENKRHKTIFVLGQIGELWDQELAVVLGAKLADEALTADSFRVVLAKLLSKSDAAAKTVAHEIALAPIPDSQEGRRKAVYGTAELISHDPTEWSVVWPVLRGNAAFGVEVLETAAYRHQYSSFATSLAEGEIADICIWISKQGLIKDDDNDADSGGLVTPSKALAQWWNMLINFVAHKGTVASCEAIRRLIEEFPQYRAGLERSLKEADNRRRRATWAPQSPQEVIHLGIAHDGFVISIHGIRTRGAWQKEVNSDLQRNGFRHEIFDYGFFRAVQLLVPRLREIEVDKFRKKCEELYLEARVPSVIAHSFGTYIVADALEKYSELRFDRIILCGSIVRRDYDWNSLIQAGRVGAVLNEWGGRDIWARVAGWSVADAGASGAFGFRASCHGLYQRFRPKFRHSDCFYPLNYRENWIPFLSGFEPTENAVEGKLRPDSNLRFRVFLLSALVVALLATYVLMRSC